MMQRVLFSLALALTSGTLFLGQSESAIADSFVPTTADLLAQEPNQDSLRMNCNGSIPVNDINYTAFFTREAGFSRVVFRRRSNGRQIAEVFLSFSKQNNQGQAVWRGSVSNAASVTLIHLASRPARRGDQVSVSYDNQWGRGTCR